MDAPIHPGNLQCFLDEYKRQLVIARKERPDEFCWPMEELDAVFDRMAQAIKVDRFNKDSDTFKRTCKNLGIKHTYRAIQEFISL